MANNNYKLNFALSDGSVKSVTFTAPQGPQGPKGDKGEQGQKGEKGDAFSISKVYESVSAMNAGYATDEVPSGGFVVIDTGSVEDEDNAKLYYKGTNSYVYLTDLSGATGLQGPQGDKGETGAKGEKGDTGVGISSVTIEEV